MDKVSAGSTFSRVNNTPRLRFKKVRVGELNGQVFPITKQWIKNSGTPDQKKSFGEYLYAVQYHMELAQDSEYKCSSALSDFKWHKFDDGALVLSNLEQDNVVRNGDIAIRECGSALDTSLLLVADTLSLEVKRRSLRIKDELLEKMQLIPTCECLAKAMKLTYASYYYDLLIQYRHWVTHRGAPRTIYDHHVVYYMPDEAKQELDKDRQDSRIKWYLQNELRKRIRIVCKQFVPPVQTRFGADIRNPSTDIDLAGIATVSNGSRHVRIGEIRFSGGSHFMTKEEYENINQSPLEGNVVNFAGESLVEYDFHDYTGAVNDMLFFVSDVLQCLWDNALKTALETRK